MLEQNSQVAYHDGDGDHKPNSKLSCGHSAYWGAQEISCLQSAVRSHNQAAVMI